VDNNGNRLDATMSYVGTGGLFEDAGIHLR
jgi:hypothetical protein